VCGLWTSPVPPWTGFCTRRAASVAPSGLGVRGHAATIPKVDVRRRSWPVAKELWWKTADRSNRSRPGAVTAVADEDGGWLWTRETQSSQCLVVTDWNASTPRPRRCMQTYAAAAGVYHGGPQSGTVSRTEQQTRNSKILPITTSQNVAIYQSRSFVVCDRFSLFIL